MKTVVLLSCLLLSSSLFACRCNEPPSIKDALSRTPIVVSGKIIDLEYVSILESIAPDKQAEANKSFLERYPYKEHTDLPMVMKVNLEVLKKYKGENVKDTITIFTGLTGASCGFTWFKVGKIFIIYASSQNYYLPLLGSKTTGLERKDTYWTHHCTRTTFYYEKEAAILEKLSAK